jgi:hypothetical protein
MSGGQVGSLLGVECLETTRAQFACPEAHGILGVSEAG